MLCVIILVETYLEFFFGFKLFVNFSKKVRSKRLNTTIFSPHTIFYFFWTEKVKQTTKEKLLAHTNIKCCVYGKNEMINHI